MTHNHYISIALSIALHIIVITLFGLFFIKPPQFGIDTGQNSIDIALEFNATPSTLPEKNEPIPIESIKNPHIISTKTTPQEKKINPTEILNKETSTGTEKETTLHHTSDGTFTETNPSYIKNTAPLYPDSARRRGQEGVVLLSILVDKNGNAISIKLKKSSGSTVLDDSAEKAVKNWKFKPALFGSTPVEFNVDIPIRFILNDR
ncbi:MAG: energy transducer TonB [Candidatus Margulisbacteria bacterium]|nr:energy transducer TonB [Candidatus Margulisiibacteriota bacterium]